MAGAVGRGASALRRRAFAVARGHAAERTLVDFAFLGARERHTVVFEFDHRSRRFLAHVLDRVLVAEPVRTLDRVVEVIAPVVLAHVAERSGNAALRRHRMRARRKHLGQADRLQALRGEAESGAQSRAARADDDDVVFVLLNLVRRHSCSSQLNTMRTTAMMPARAAAAQTNLFASCATASSQRVST